MTHFCFQSYYTTVILKGKQLPFPFGTVRKQVCATGMLMISINKMCHAALGMCSELNVSNQPTETHLGFN